MEELQQIGLADGQKLKLDHDDLDALLAGRRTSMLRLEDLAFDDMQIKQLDAKLSLQRNADESVSLLLHPIHREPEAPAYLTASEVEALEKGEKANILKTLEDPQGNQYDVLIEFDKDTNEFIVSDTDHIEAPEQVNGVPLTAEQKKNFKKGKEVQTEDGTTIQYAASEKQGIRSDKLHLVVSIVLDGGLSFMLYKAVHALWGQKHDPKKENNVGTKYAEAFEKYKQQEGRARMRPVFEGKAEEQVNQGYTR